MDKSEYSEKLKDPRWQEVRKRIMKRDGYRCRDSLFSGKEAYRSHEYELTPEEEECAEPYEDGIELHVHHCFYEKGDPWDTGDEYLICVGREEHFERHAVEDRIKRAVAKICANTRNHTGHGDRGDLGSFAKSLETLANSYSYNPGDMVMATLKPKVVDGRYSVEDAEAILAQALMFKELEEKLKGFVDHD